MGLPSSLSCAAWLSSCQRVARLWSSQGARGQCGGIGCPGKADRLEEAPTPLPHGPHGLRPSLQWTSRTVSFPLFRALSFPSSPCSASGLDSPHPVLRARPRVTCIFAPRLPVSLPAALRGHFISLVIPLLGESVSAQGRGLSRSVPQERPTGRGAPPPWEDTPHPCPHPEPADCQGGHLPWRFR